MFRQQHTYYNTTYNVPTYECENVSRVYKSNKSRDFETEDAEHPETYRHKTVNILVSRASSKTTRWTVGQFACWVSVDRSDTREPEDNFERTESVYNITRIIRTRPCIKVFAPPMAKQYIITARLREFKSLGLAGRTDRSSRPFISPTDRSRAAEDSWGDVAWMTIGPGAVWKLRRHWVRVMILIIIYARICTDWLRNVLIAASTRLARVLKFKSLCKNPCSSWVEKIGYVFRKKIIY